MGGIQQRPDVHGQHHLRRWNRHGRSEDSRRTTEISRIGKRLEIYIVLSREGRPGNRSNHVGFRIFHVCHRRGCLSRKTNREGSLGRLHPREMAVRWERLPRSHGSRTGRLRWGGRRRGRRERNHRDGIARDRWRFHPRVRPERSRSDSSRRRRQRHRRHPFVFQRHRPSRIRFWRIRLRRIDSHRTARPMFRKLLWHSPPSTTGSVQHSSRYRGGERFGIAGRSTTSPGVWRCGRWRRWVFLSGAFEREVCLSDDDVDPHNVIMRVLRTTRGLRLMEAFCGYCPRM
mmetsp:Transcript_443/g.799  ORF Transcript_443/g.799 Transcript_443/m.799 type:complete len:287 (+) Transcript_443:1746-2606(+)